MSGSIRKALGPAKARANALIQQNVPVYDDTGLATPRDKLHHLNEVRIQISHLMTKLTNSIALLSAKDEQWLQLINSLRGQDKTDEELQYGAAIDSATGHYNILMNAQDKLAELKSNLQELDLLAENLHAQNQPVPVVNVPQPVVNVQAPPQAQGPAIAPPPPAAAPVQLQTLKLPKIELPAFNGDPTNWKVFWDLFRSSVHTQNISGVQKFAYLSAKLTGTAAAAISGLPITDDNYDTAVNLLQQRFGKESIIKNALFAKIRNLRVSNAAVKELRATSDAIERNLRQLESMGENIEQSMMIDVLRGKIPPDILLDMHKLKPMDQEWTVALFRQILKQVIETQEDIQRITQMHIKGAQGQSPNSNQSQVKSGPPSKLKQATVPTDSTASSVETLTTTVGQTSQRGQQTGQGSGRSKGQHQKGKKPPSCLFCQQTHYSNQCDQYTTVASRKKLILEKRNPSYCLHCLRSGHFASNCTVTVRCYFCKSNRHHSALCPQRFGTKTPVGGYSTGASEDTNQPATSEQPPSTSSASVSSHTVSVSCQNMSLEANANKLVPENNNFHSTSAMLFTALATIQNPENPHLHDTVHVLFDSGSQRSFILQSLADKLHLPTLGYDALSIHSFATKVPQSKQSAPVTFDVITHDGSETIHVDANALPYLSCPQQRNVLTADDYQFVLHSMASASFADTIPSQPQFVYPTVFIGNDFFWDFFPDFPRTVLPSGMIAVPSKLGMLLGGRQKIDDSKMLQENQNSLQVNFIINQALPELNPYEVDTVSHDAEIIAGPNIEDYWKLECIGISDSLDTTDDQQALEQFEKSIQFHENRYQVKWPYKENIFDLPTNYALALRRFSLLVQRFRKDPQLLEKYSQVIKEQLARGIIELVSNEENDDDIIHYLSHHPIIQPQRQTTKVRIVYDGSAKQRNSLSVNDCLYRGPIILPDLVGLLLRFRLSPVSVIADIEKAFLQIGLQPSDREITRFFWLKDTERCTLENNLAIYRFCRVPFGLISSPFLLCATVRHHLQKSDSWVAPLVSMNIYVDNVILSLNSPQEAKEFYTETKKIFASASMNLREWNSNSEEFKASIPAHDKVESTVVKVLGLSWSTDTDMFTLKGMTKFDTTSPSSKREILKLIASIFDPLGFVTPVTLAGKLFLQNLWELKLEWDDLLSPELQEQWKKIQLQLCDLFKFQIPRFLPIQKIVPCSLHVFVDASKDAYAAVAYLRQRCKGENEHTLYFVFSKLRLAPHKPKLSIPRLELLSVLIGSRIAKFLKSQLSLANINKFVICTDSQCCLYWLKNPQILNKFVGNRVREIKQLQSDVSSMEFRYVSSKDNPADIATRGKSADELLSSSLWWNGPTWLKSNDQWPNSNLPPITGELLVHIEREHLKNPQPVFIETTGIKVVDKVNFFNIDLSKFSSLKHLLRTTVYCLRFLKKICKLSNPLFESIQLQGPILAKEISTAQFYWIRVTQVEYHAMELSTLQSNKRSTDLIKQLGLILDTDGILRCQGRFTRAVDRTHFQFPILLHRKAPFTKLIIFDVHERSLHSGAQYTLASIRKQFWIPQGRILVRQVLHNCVICRKVSGGSFALPKMASLPFERINRAAPFAFTGIDYFGHIWFKLGTEKQKGWVCLFTCLVRRAVHLELVTDMSTQQFLQAMRRFIAKRGTPIKIISDNAPQLKMGSDVIVQVWTQTIRSDDLLNYCSNNSITFQLITPFAPWEGGVYERLVGITKLSLKKAIGRRMLSLEQFITFLAEVEAVVNSRPITHLYDDINSPLVLRPIDFLIPHGYIGTPEFDEDLSDPDYIPRISAQAKLIHFWHSSQKELDKFWSYWYDEYIGSLRERHTMEHQKSRNQVEEIPQPGQVVLIQEELTPRGAWKLGRVQDVTQSADGAVRRATITLPNKKIITRPVNLLHPLEVQSHLSDSTNVSCTKVSSLPKKKSQSSRGMLSFGTVLTTLNMTVLMCLWFVTFTSGSMVNRTYQLCSGGCHGHAISVPKQVKCMFPRDRPLETTIVELWLQREFPQRTAAHHCYAQVHVIATHMGFFGSKGITGDVNTFIDVSPQECWNAVRTKTWKQMPLYEITPGFWSTNNTLHVEYVWCCTDHINQVTNFFMERGEIASIDGQKVVSDLQEVAHCLATSGLCKSPTSSVIVWNGTKFKNQCAYELRGTYYATLSGNPIIVHHIQGAFSFSGHSHPDGSECIPTPAFYTDQGAVFVRFVNNTPSLWFAIANQSHLVSNEETTHEDTTDYKCMFLFKKIQKIERQQFNVIWQHMCSIRQSQLDHVWQLLRLDTTFGTRALLGRDDVFAQWAGESLMFWTCKQVQAVKVFWDGRVNDTCYEFLPVQLRLEGPIWFVVPGTRDLVDKSPVAICGHTLPHLFEQDGKWFSHYGPAHVTNLPLEFQWKDMWKTFTFGTPSLFVNHLTHWPAYISPRHQLSHFIQVERMVHRLIDYTSEMSFDPRTIHNTLSGIGASVGHVIESTGKAAGHYVYGLTSGLGAFVSNILKGPIQLLINLCIIVLVIIIISFCLYKYILWHRKRGLKFWKRKKSTTSISVIHHDDPEMGSQFHEGSLESQSHYQLRYQL